ncbi:hypothetical protein QRX60_30280 [Amycolatopsis mongoliensis]|uniref:Uncharacterized protein n=1 Tax=Amycolatopsis mongoliensis TaxID=715475 RepID=A0A9Y2NMY1_9PSEU|nr:hypothetical protein [Amycolatopsis sp. 4-36]WIY07664.1 hypothetical protein QRX60_30280 [Amycolatopsis sp. 4-36]
MELVRSSTRYRCIRASIDGAEPILLACLVLDDGDLLAPSGRERALAELAAGKPVAITATYETAGHGTWMMAANGLARPLTPADQPHRLPRAQRRFADSFDHGVRIVIARLTAHEITDSAQIPHQRAPHHEITFSSQAGVPGLSPSPRP